MNVFRREKDEWEECELRRIYLEAVAFNFCHKKHFVCVKAPSIFQLSYFEVTSSFHVKIPFSSFEIRWCYGSGFEKNKYLMMIAEKIVSRVGQLILIFSKV